MTDTDQREVLEALWREINPAPVQSSPDYGDWRHCSNIFTAMLDAGAYLDAAMMLVPEDVVDWSIGRFEDGSGTASLWFADDREICEEAATPALALCAAIRAAKDAAP